LFRISIRTSLPNFLPNNLNGWTGIMAIFRQIGKRHYEIARLWTGTAGAFGGTAFGLFLYLSDWKLILANVPIYGSKFDREIPR